MTGGNGGVPYGVLPKDKMPQHFDRPCHFWDLIQKNQLLSTEPIADIV